MNDAFDHNRQQAGATEHRTLLTTHNAAEYLGLSKSTLNKWRCHGGGPVFVKLGRAVRYREEDLARFLSERAKRSTSDA